MISGGEPYLKNRPDRLIAVEHGLGNFPSLSAQGITNANLPSSYELLVTVRLQVRLRNTNRIKGLLDRRIVNFATQLPQEYLIQNGWHKFILRKVAEPYLPKEVTWRRNKMGFHSIRRMAAESKELIYANLHDQEIPYYARKLFMNYDPLRWPTRLHCGDWFHWGYGGGVSLKVKKSFLINIIAFSVTECSPTSP